MLYGVYMDYLFIFQVCEGLVDVGGYYFVLLVGVVCVVIVFVQLGSYKVVVFVYDYVVIDDSGVVEQIGQVGVFGMMFFQFQFGIDCVDVGKEDE